MASKSLLWFLRLFRYDVMSSKIRHIGFWWNELVWPKVWSQFQIIWNTDNIRYRMKIECYNNMTSFLINPYIATWDNWRTFYLFDSKAPPQLNFFVRNPVLISAACQGCVPNELECPPTILFDLVYSSPQAETTLQKKVNCNSAKKKISTVNH